MKNLLTVLSFLILIVSITNAQKYDLAWGFAEFDDELPDGTVIDSTNLIYSYIGGDSVFMERYNHGRDVAVDKWNNNIFVYDYRWGYLEAWPPYNYVFGNDGPDIAIRKSDEFGNEIWTKFLEGQKSNNPWAVETDSEGNIIVTGFFAGSLDFDPGPDEYIMNSTVGGALGQNSFILKLNPDGEFIFAKQIESTLRNRSYGIAVDHQDNIFVVGNYRGTTDFDPGEEIANETALHPNGHLYALKLDQYGDYLWHYTAFSTNYSLARGCVVDNQGALYTVGFFRDTINFSTTSLDYRIANGFRDGCVFKLDSEGNFNWAKNYNDAGSFEINDVCFDGQDIIVASQFKDSVNVSSTAPSHWLYTPNGTGSFFQKLDISGNEVYAQTFTEEDIEIWNINSNSRKELFFSGTVSGQKIIELPTGTDTIATLGNDIYCAMVDTAAQLRWFKSWPSEGDDRSFGATMDNKGNILLTGIYRDLLDLDLRDSLEYILIGEGTGHESYLFQLNQCNQYNSIAVEACSEYISPSQEHTWYSSGTYIDTVPASTGCDSILVIDLTISSTSQQEVDLYGCDYLVSPSGNYMWDISGTYYDTLSTASGCDSILEINLSIVNIETSVTTDLNTITANHSTGSYRWLNCDNNSIIPFETSQSFVATESGNFAVEITDQGCVDTSACSSIILTTAAEVFNIFEILVYPNPSNGQVLVQPSSNIGMYTLKIYNSLGQLVQKHQVSSGSNYVVDMAEGKGVYWLEILSGNGVSKIERVVFN